MKASELYEIMNIDPLGEIHDRTGIHHSHPTLGDAATLASIPIFHAKADVLRREMAERSDTHPGMTLADYETALAEEGFELVLTEPVAVGPASAPSDLLVHAHREGVLVYVCTYGAERRPGQMNPNMAFNWRGDTRHLPFGYSGRSSWGKATYMSVNIDTGFRLKLATLREHGAFVAPWVEAPFIWLLSCQEGVALTKDEVGREALKAERIAKLPEWVRAFMRPAS